MSTAGPAITKPKLSKTTEQPMRKHWWKLDFMESCLPSFLTIAIFFTCTTLEWLFLCPWYIYTYSMEVWLPIIAIFSITTITSVANFSYASFMNPGFLPKAPDLRYMNRQPSTVNVNGVDIHLKHCRTCHYYRMPRTIHCSQCDYCVDNFDHHCPWVNNCIGRRNYRFFFTFLCCLTCHIITSISICVNSFLHQPGGMLSNWNAQKVTAISVASIAGIIMVPVVGLLCFHIFLISRGLSTYEYVTKKYKNNDFKSPFDMGPCKNCAFQLCGPEFPVFKPPAFYADDENDSHEVQRGLVAKFAASGKANGKEKDNVAVSKLERIENLAAGDALCSVEISKPPANHFCDDGRVSDNDSVSHQEEDAPKQQPVYEQSEASIAEQSSPTISFKTEFSDHQNDLNLSQDSGEFYFSIPSIFDLEKAIQCEQIILPSP